MSKPIDIRGNPPELESGFDNTPELKIDINLWKNSAASNCCRCLVLFNFLLGNIIVEFVLKYFVIPVPQIFYHP